MDPEGPRAGGPLPWAAALVATVFLAAAAPQPASAGYLEDPGAKGGSGLLKEFGGDLNYDEKVSKENAFAQSRAALLEETAKKEREKAARKFEEAAQKAKAERLFRQLNEKRDAEELREKATLREQTKKSKSVLEQMKKKKAEAATTDSKTPIAQQLFEKFFTNQEAKREAEEKAIREKEEARQKVLAELQARREAAEKAAADAEAVAAKIEALAADARKTADLAKQLAEVKLKLEEIQKVSETVGGKLSVEEIAALQDVKK